MGKSYSEWLPVSEIAKIRRVSERAIIKWAKDLPGEYVTKQQDKGRYGYKLLISLEALISDERMEYLKESQEIKDLFSDALDDLTDWQIKTALDRYIIVEEVIRLRANKYKSKKTISISRFAKQIGKSPTTILEWERRYRQDGLRGLAPQWNTNRGKRIALHEDVQEFLKADYLRPQRPSFLAIYERLQAFCEKHGYRTPAYNTVRNYLKNDIPYEAAVLYREGQNAWKVKCEPYIERDLNSLRPNQMWVMDSREMDVFVYIDKEKKIAVRPWLVLDEDMGSRKFTGWRLCLQPDSWQLALALRDGILRNGIPEELYIDNGKDYTSHFFGGKSRRRGKSKLNLEAESVLANLRIKKHNALPYNPQSKPIEPAFRIFHRLEQECPGWCGRDNKNRPEKLELEFRRGELLTFDEFQLRVAAHIEWYNNRLHKALGMSPNELRAKYNFVTINESDLDIMLLKKKDVIVHRNGLHLFSLTYFSDELQQKTYVRDRVTIRYNPDDISVVRVYKDHEFLCNVYPQQKISPRATEKEMRKVAKIKRQARERIKNFPIDREIAVSVEKALEFAMKTTRREPDLPPIHEQGPAENIKEKKFTKGAFLRASEKGRDPYHKDTPLTPTHESNGRMRPQPDPGMQHRKINFVDLGISYSHPEEDEELLTTDLIQDDFDLPEDLD